MKKWKFTYMDNGTLRHALVIATDMQSAIYNWPMWASFGWAVLKIEQMPLAEGEYI